MLSILESLLFHHYLFIFLLFLTYAIFTGSPLPTPTTAVKWSLRHMTDKEQTVISAKIHLN